MASNTKPGYPTKLIQPGEVDNLLHYGPLASFWWSLRAENDHIIAIPVRKNMWTSTKVKNVSIELIVTADEINKPEFTAYCGNHSFKASTSSLAVNKVYQMHLQQNQENSNTKFNGIAFL